MSFYRSDMASQKTTAENNPTTSVSCDSSDQLNLFCNRLSECGWREEVWSMCRNILRERGTSINAEARAVLPDIIKMELLMKIRSSLAAQSDEAQSTDSSDETVSVVAAEGD